MRAFVIGNGPSLRSTPLDRLKGEISFATNRIHLIYPHTTWRPTHYVRAEEMTMPDQDVWKVDITTHLEMKVEVWCNKWFMKWIRNMGKHNPKQVHIIKPCPHYQYHFDVPECPHLWHMPRLCTFGSSVNVAIQIAVQQGFSPIYLIGCDLGYSIHPQAHFDPHYTDGYQGYLREARYADMDTLTAHAIAARSSPAPIYNATLGGYLEAYPRVKFEELF